MVCEGWEGSTVDGKFPLLEWLGGWADRCVFLTVRHGIQRANIKLVQAGGAEAEARLANWQTAAALSHPSLVQLMESGRYNIHDTDVVYLVTEKADAFLSGVIPRKALHPSEAKAILDSIVDALAYLHGRELTHGSVKPANIVKVGDQWKLASDEMVESGDFAKAGRKPDAYDAPEIADGKLTPAADLWSLGIIAVEAFSQRTPVWDRDAKADLGVPVWVMPEPFREMARGCLRWDPAERISIADAKALLARYTPTSAAEEAAAPPVAAAPVVDSTLPLVAQQPRVEQKKEPEAVRAEPADSFREPEPVEFAPRSRLFTNLGEEEDEHTGRKGSFVLAILVLLAIIALVAIRFRGRLFSPGETHNVPAENQSSPPPQTAKKEAAPSQPVPANPAQPPAPDQQPAGSAESHGAPLESQQPQAPAVPPTTKPEQPVQPAQAANPPATKPETSPPSEPAPQPKRETVPSPAANSKGEVVKRVLPDVEPGATGSMRRPVEVELRVSVNEDGKVSNVEYETRGPGNYFARKARQAAQEWKFKAPESNGQAMASHWVLLFRFERRRTDVTATEVH